MDNKEPFKYETLCTIEGCKIVKIVPSQLYEAQKLSNSGSEYAKINFIPKSPRRRR